MSENSQTNATPSASINKAPDVLLDIVRFVDEKLVPTSMKSKGFGDKASAQKFQRSAELLNPVSGKTAIAPIVGTMAQWDSADLSKAEGYAGVNKAGVNVFYIQPHLGSAEVEASLLV